jgi:hypothetical protein
VLAGTNDAFAPIEELERRYFPFEDCNPFAMTDTASRSSFFRGQKFDDRRGEYLFKFSNDDVEFTFGYEPGKRTLPPGAGPPQTYSISCHFRFWAYVRELDPLLAKAKNSTKPIHDLNDRYFPFEYCDPRALIEVASHSRFFRDAPYDRLGEEYEFTFLSDDVHVGFSYRPKERTSLSPSAGFLEK